MTKSPVKQKKPIEVPAKIEEAEEREEGEIGKRSIKHHHQTDIPHEESALSRKLSGFLERLKSDDRKSVEDNAKMLAKFVQHFSCNFSVDVNEIMKVMEEQKGDIDINKVRAKFIKGL